MRMEMRSLSSRMTVVGMILLMLLSVGALGVAGTAIAQDVNTADRTIEDTQLQPGEATEITVEIDIDGEAAPALTEDFSASFADVEIIEESPDAFVAGPDDDNQEVVVLWGEEASSLEVTYEVTVPEDAEPGDEFSIDGAVTVGEDADEEASVTGDETIEVVEEPPVEVESAERTIEDEQLMPGSSTEVTVEFDLSEDAAASVVEAFEPGFADIEVVDEDPGAFLAEPDAANEELIALWEEEAETFSITYEVSVPEDAEGGDTFEFEGSVIPGEDDDIDGTPIEGDNAISIVEEPPIDIDAERTIERPQVTEGASTEVTLEIEAEEAISLGLTEDFDPGFAEAEYVDSEPEAFLADSDEANEEFIATWDTEATSFELTYEVTVPEDAEAGDTFEISGFVPIEDVEVPIEGDDTIEVVESPLAEYADEDGFIDAQGVLAAFGDWQDGELDAQLFLEAFNAWTNNEPVL